MHARDYTHSKKLIWIWRRKIYIFMQCAPDPYEFFQSIFGLIFGHMTEIVARRS